MRNKFLIPDCLQAYETHFLCSSAPMFTANKLPQEVNGSLILSNKNLAMEKSYCSAVNF